jgi:hypothetical protein
MSPGSDTLSRFASRDTEPIGDPMTTCRPPGDSPWIAPVAQGPFSRIGSALSRVKSAVRAASGVLALALAAGLAAGPEWVREVLAARLVSLEASRGLSGARGTNRLDPAVASVRTALARADGELAAARSRIREHEDRLLALAAGADVRRLERALTEPACPCRHAGRARLVLRADLP